MDGVLADFYPYFRRYFYTRLKIRGIHPLDVDVISYDTKKRISNIVHMLCEDEKSAFWENIPRAKNGTYYWKHLEPVRDQIMILTGIRPDMDEAIIGKTMWIKKAFGLSADRIIFDPDKEKYATKDGVRNLLIDDSHSNIVRFNEAGGIGILELGKRAVASYNVHNVILPMFNDMLL